MKTLFNRIKMAYRLIFGITTVQEEAFAEVTNLPDTSNFLGSIGTSYNREEELYGFLIWSLRGANTFSGPFKHLLKSKDLSVSDKLILYSHLQNLVINQPIPDPIEEAVRHAGRDY